MAELRRVIAAKEQELHDINEYRNHTLDTLLQDKDREIGENKSRLQKLKGDFQYNLKLLEERDAELERYDGSFASLKAVIRERDIELSELKIACTELRHSVKQERDRAADAECYYQQKLAHTQEEAEASRWKLEEQLRSQRDEFEAHKREFERGARNAQEAHERQRSAVRERVHPAGPACSSDTEWFPAGRGCIRRGGA